MKKYDKIYIPIRTSERMPSVPDNYFTLDGETSTEFMYYWNGKKFEDNISEQPSVVGPEEWLEPTRDVIVMTREELDDIVFSITGLPRTQQILSNLIIDNRLEYGRDIR